MPGVELSKTREYEGTGIKSLGNTRLYAKICALSFSCFAAVYAYCAAYVFTAGIFLISYQKMVIAFFVSLSAMLISLMGTIALAVKLHTVGKYDLSMMMPGGKFDYGGLVVNQGKFVKGGTVKAEVTVNGVTNRSLTGFDVYTSATAAVMTASLCSFAATMGMLTAQSRDLAGIIEAFVAPTSAVARVCLLSIAVFVVAAVLDVLRHSLFDHGSRLMVLEEGVRKISEDDIVCIADKLNVNSSNILHVKIYNVQGIEAKSGSVSK